MTTYSISGTAPDLFVINDMGATMGGPYKNDDSAKRRIRNLRQKDAEALNGKPTTSEIVAQDRANEMARDDHPHGPLLADVEETREVAELARIAATTIAPKAMTDDAVQAMKLASSSAYGKFNGVYPAIGKRERRRQWNYA